MRPISMARVLLIEDSSDYQILVARTLSHHQLDIANNATEAAQLLSQNPYDLILLDISLPLKDGYTILSELQAHPQTADIPVICLTGKTAVADKITAFTLGAEDYLSKPFDPLELRARVDAKLARRRRKSRTTSRMQILDLEIDRISHRVFTKEGDASQEISLTPTEYKLLCCLAQAPDQIFSREQLLASVWGGDTKVLGRVVDVHICSLRKKLKDRSGLIRAVPGIGYKILVPQKSKAA